MSSVKKQSSKKQNQKQKQKSENKGKSKRKILIKHDAHIRRHMELITPVLRRHRELSTRLAVVSGALKTQYFASSKDVKESSDEKDLKEQLQKVEAEMQLIKNAFRAGMGETHTYFTLAYDPGASTSSANTALATVDRIRPSDSAEFSALAALFDEYKAVDASTYVQVNGSGNTNGYGHWGVAYDPSNNSAYGSVAALVVARSHLGPIAMSQFIPYQYTHNGLQHLHVTFPKGTDYSYGAVTSIGTGVWTDCSVTAVDYGYFKFYLEALGGSNTSILSRFMKMGVLFRMRT